MPNPRKPSSLKVLHGTDRPDRRNPDEPTPPDLEVGDEAPEWLSDLAREAWSDIAPILRDMGVLTVADVSAFVLLTDALGEYIAARKTVMAEGATYWTHGKIEMLRTRPEVGIAQDAWRRAKTMLGEFGLTPASRARVSGTPKGEEDPLEKWAKQG